MYCKVVPNHPSRVLYLSLSLLLWLWWSGRRAMFVAKKRFELVVQITKCKPDGPSEVLAAHAVEHGGYQLRRQRLCSVMYLVLQGSQGKQY